MAATAQVIWLFACEVPARPWVDVCLPLALFKFVPQKGPLKNIISGTYFRSFTVYQVEFQFSRTLVFQNSASR